MAQRTGRPPVDNPKTVKYSIRLDEDTERRLVAYCGRAGITKGEAFRRGVRLLLAEKESSLKEAHSDGV